MSTQTLTHDSVRARLDAIFVGDDIRDAMTVRRHLRGCDRCRDYFEQLASADGALTGGHAAPGFARRFSDAVLRAGVRTVDQAPESLLDRVRRAFTTQVWLGFAGAAVALLAVFAWWSLPGTQSTDDGFQPRTALVPADSFKGVRQLEVLCVSEVGGRVVFGAAQAGDGFLRCDRASELKFLYLNKADSGSGQLPYLALFAFDEAGRILWYRPADTEDPAHGSMRVEEAARLRGLGESLAVDAQHKDGTYEVYGVFTAAPLRRDAVEAHFQDEFAPLGAGLDLDGVVADAADGDAVILGADALGEYIVRHQTLKVGKESP